MDSAKIHLHVFIVDTFHGFRNSYSSYIFSDSWFIQIFFRFFLGDTLSCCSCCWHGIHIVHGILSQIHGDTFSWLQFLFDSYFYLGFSNSGGVVIAIQLWDFENRSMLHFSCLGDLEGDWFGLLLLSNWLSLEDDLVCNLTLHALEFFLWNSVVWWSISTLDWLIDWLIAFGFCKFDTSCSYRSQLCPSLSVRQIWHFMLSNTFSGISSFDGDSCPSARLIISVRFPQKFDTSSVECFLGTWFFDGAHASFCALIGGRWNWFCFLPT
jgi:hypothetical protein